MDLDALLAPISDERPCGENLEYHADFIAMEQACAGKAEQQFGDTVIPAEPADWNRVEALATSLLMRSKDLRVMLVLTRAWTQLQGLRGYAKGLQLIAQSVQRFWQSLYPALDEEGEAEPWHRINALAGLSDKSALTMAVRHSSLLRSVADEITLRDACLLLEGSKTDLADYPGGRVRLMDELARSQHPNIAALLNISEYLQTVRALLTERLGESAVPAMEQLIKTVNTVAQACHATDLAALIPTQVKASGVKSHPAPVTLASAGGDDWRSAVLQSRGDALLMLDKVKQFFAENEPGHPAPLMIERVQRVIGLDFMEMMRELAPEGVTQLENILGRRAN
ncbi:type VI secretion system protein TssA [Pantoea sp. B65]|uniref:type VI secretion system protein TssA n=1 Tax=Pantoea sp. B65 TaxID=2813359 RepID=UPI0039B40AED